MLDSYPQLADEMDKAGYTWDSHKIQTEDGWWLTLFHVTGKVGENSAPWREYPVHVQHGANMDAQYWIERSNIEGVKSWPLQLVDEGYDVWLGSSRGTRYSNFYVDEETDAALTEEERWNFTWDVMGLYDQPANIDKILEETGKKKVTYIGYSQGTS